MFVTEKWLKKIENTLLNKIISTSKWLAEYPFAGEIHNRRYRLCSCQQTKGLVDYDTWKLFFVKEQPILQLIDNCPLGTIPFPLYRGFPGQDIYLGLFVIKIILRDFRRVTQWSITVNYNRQSFENNGSFNHKCTFPTLAFM